ncbi:MBL fold metallo-hydrolase [Candidatus Woesearchaeota archaeon]|jgi:L-ascorbate metabolism protein UlaG (beta-lactamase superfamily)|nr:MBL fold metallo-hydrolase [Candidatus Woesearchaeota archaeon]
MNITWLGQSCFKIEEKVKGEVVTVVTDPYDKTIGLRLPKSKANLVTVSHDHHDHNNVEGVLGLEEKEPFIIDRSGEYEYKGVFVTGVGSFHDKKEGEERGKSVMFRIEIAGVSVLHCGDLGTKLSDAQLEKIGEVDILLVPVGGKYTVNAKEAAEVVRQIEPRVVVPMHYKIPGLDLDIDDVKAFSKEMGNGSEVIGKLKMNKKDLPIDEIKLVILEKQ